MQQPFRIAAASPGGTRLWTTCLSYISTNPERIPSSFTGIPENTRAGKS
jgi:hypothetical protein